MLGAKEFVLPDGISYEEMIKIGGNYNAMQFQDAVPNVVEIEYHKNVGDRSSGNKVYAVFDEPKTCYACPFMHETSEDICWLLDDVIPLYGDREEVCPLQYYKEDKNE